MKGWLVREPIVIVEGHGAVLRDAHGREYLDANSSIWTNLHGHNEPRINLAIARQLEKIAHSSALGLANGPASRLAEKLVATAGQSKLRKVFFSDDGSTAMEVALKLAFEFSRRTRGQARFLSLKSAYHGDTLGAVALGKLPIFHHAYKPLLFKTDSVPAPYCYRCPHNRAKPERADARTYRKCAWECLDRLEQKLSLAKKSGRPHTAFVFEPLIQGAAGMVPQPAGWLKKATSLARGQGALLIADEVMTGFGRTGTPRRRTPAVNRDVSNRKPASDDPPPLFACQHEKVQPDFLALAKGLTGGYLPMAATLTAQRIFDAFLGEHDEFKTFFHGHSYTGNQLGAAAALASLEILQTRASTENRARLQERLALELSTLWNLPNVGDVRQVGLAVGIELVRNWRTREPFPPQARVGAQVCEAMAKHGILTRPVGDVIVLMPPYCTTPSQLRKMISAIRLATIEVMLRGNLSSGAAC